MSKNFRQRCCRFVVGVSILSLLLILKGRSVALEPEPNPALSPADVVRIQVEALKNDRIDIVFRFASRQNKAYSGPLSRFTEMLKSPTYIAMLHYGSVRYGPLLKKGGGQAYRRSSSPRAEGKLFATFSSCRNPTRTHATGAG